MGKSWREPKASFCIREKREQVQNWLGIQGNGQGLRGGLSRVANRWKQVPLQGGSQVLISVWHRLMCSLTPLPLMLGL